MEENARARTAAQKAPGTDENAHSGSLMSYTIGLAFALLLTGASFLVSQSHLLWPPGVPAGLAVLAIAQMGFTWCSFCTSVPARITPTMWSRSPSGSSS
jgi:heme/copper-type cytochrome/quinol oxidase subunit 4